MAMVQRKSLEIFLSDKRSKKDKLLAVRSLKQLFKTPDKVFGKLKLKSMLKISRTTLQHKTSNITFFHEYGTSLVDFFGRNAIFDAELLYQLGYILGELKKNNGYLEDELVPRLWSRLGCKYPDELLQTSKQAIERSILDCIETPCRTVVEFFAKMSVDSPKLFQSLTSVLYEVLARTCADKKVFEVTNDFVKAVKYECQKEGKNFLMLYPKDCRQLVSLLMGSPEVFSFEERMKVVSSLLELFFQNRKRVLILLSHFKAWVMVFQRFLENEII